ncbi:MAG: protein kinase [Planctomycetes bacterium]|nr:protein kinase [Planctomycetota bacterium]
MGSDNTEPNAAAAPADLGSIESVCENFEIACNRGSRPTIESLLPGWEEPERSKLLSELLLLELNDSSRKGETLVSHVYESRFPDHRHVVKDVFDRWLTSRKADTVTGVDDTLEMRSQFGQLRLHAQGGLGMVFRADDQRLSREVAVKFIRANLASDTESRDRFRLEAEITSRLEHPGIVPVYGLGDTGENELFYAMRFIQGQTLEDSINRFHHGEQSDEGSSDDRDRRFRELLERFIAVCKTMAYAHNRGIVHRDIKPENVMLGRYGETIVIDWGLAIHVSRQGVFKQSGEMTLMPSSDNSSGDSWGGTPAYMSPEQASGMLELTPASDIYSLGVTLYKILAGGVPFTGTLQELRSAVIRGDFKKPTSQNMKASKTVEAICLRAMALSPADRYETALDLSRDVENYLADAPVSAYEEPLSRRFARWGRRHRTLSQSLLGTLLAVTIVGVLAAAIFSQLRSEAVVLQQSEHELRKNSLSVSARFAARTIADKIDIRLRILEAAAESPALLSVIRQVDQQPQDQALREPLQQWLDDELANQQHIESRSWFVCTSDGSQVARYPQFQEDGTPFGSLRNNYRYRDYFHGQLSDFETGPAIEEPHVSIAMESTNGGDLIVVFSVPIKPILEEPSIGIIGMSIELGQFADLDILLPAGQKVILVDTRRYFMKLKDSNDKGPSGEGLLLHHEDLTNVKTADDLPHLDESIVKLMRDTSADQALTENLVRSGYRDPLANAGDRSPLAAFAPVILTARPLGANARHTNWFVIIQQQ